MSVDIVLINPGDRKQIYQELGQDFSAVEPPFWIAVIAQYLRNNGFSVAVIDSNAENIAPDQTAARVNELNPILSAVIVYGSQPSASTQNMTIATNICSALKEKTSSKVAIGGLHPSALPEQTLKEVPTDFVVKGEGQLTLKLLLDKLEQNNNDCSDVPGLCYSNEGIAVVNSAAPLSKNIDEILPVGAWDLLPMDKYKAHNWHCFDHIDNRMPYAAIYTSLGCPYSCVFCCINAPFGKPGIRYRSPQIVVDEIELLVTKYGVKNIKIIDELFVLKDSHYMTIVDMVLEKKFDLNFWAYARVDTVKEENLAKLKKAGVNWLALGIESANPNVRDGAEKRMRVADVQRVVKLIQNAGIRVIGNYIFGLPDDDLSTMQETLDMAIELNCEFANFYSAMAYPGSKLYEIAVSEGWKLPDTWHGFSQHSYEMLPLPTKYLTAAQVLEFRDNAFHEYFENPTYLNMVSDRFGEYVKQHVQVMTKTRLRRKILEEVVTS